MRLGISFSFTTAIKNKITSSEVDDFLFKLYYFHGEKKTARLFLKSQKSLRHDLKNRLEKLKFNYEIHTDM